MLAFHYIDTKSALDKLVSQYQQADLLVLDTEFVRTRTYYARLGLIQAYDGKTLALIDPLAIEDLSTFWALLSDESITKLVHSCSEDLEVFAHYGHCQPTPLFDSQLAASICGFGHGLGYAKLVEQFLGVELDKGESRTDWLKRPLTDAQLQYAANDVYYLYQLYPLLHAEAVKQQRLEWILEDGQRMTVGRFSKTDVETAYLKVKNASQLTSYQLAYLKALATWRMEQALSQDMALGFVIKDHALIALAKKQPKNMNELYRLGDLTEQEKRIHGKEILQILQTADLDNLPAPLDVLALKSGYKAAFKLVKNQLIEICEQQNIPAEILASKRYIHEFLQWHLDGRTSSKPPLLCGWRGALAAKLLLALDIQL